MSINVLRDLRDLRVQVVHPPDEEGISLVEHLRRIGCTVEANWPIPDSPAPQADVLMLHIDYDQRDPIRKLLRQQGDQGPAVIAIVDYENPSTLQIVLECGALAVTEKPIRPFGLLTNIILARTLWLERQATARKMRKFEAKLSGIQKIQRAKAILMQSQALSEDEAYSTIRKQAMTKRTSMEDMASAIINANDLLTKKFPRT
ncbi:ANTAR domain-containing protein [Lichenihabitans sp. Uapishka_5]|uniref:ANTAR domain-containing response regulator n=1 Tax=Lichenihabitans sp. Uapishka_5 TaxID=3037302 RepID=UPI0029E7ED5F|nr:ANTAR domain-containing protein [Lichenihabitans sp. Uapishka_5]MDX7950784.1 ANTAR domain-containing protein [Lichenihabitans sp. Uapishka_5]